MLGMRVAGRGVGTWIAVEVGGGVPGRMPVGVDRRRGRAGVMAVVDSMAGMASVDRDLRCWRIRRVPLPKVMRAGLRMHARMR